MIREPAILALLAVRRAPLGAPLARVQQATSAGDLMPTLITPDAIRQRILVIDGQVDLLDKDISKGKDRVFVERWAEWYKHWKAWKDKVYPDYWLLFWSGKATDEELTQWQTELGKWREEAKSRGVEIVSPAPPGPPPSTQPTQITPVLEGITTAAVAIGIVGLGIVLAKNIKR